MASKNEPLGPVALIAFGVGAVALAATAVWFTARPQVALVYGILRSIELPFLNKLLPYSEYFTISSLRTGTVPAFNMIYWNSLIYGLVFTALILLLCFMALGRIEKDHIKKHVQITSKAELKFGRSFTDVMDKYAETRPDVRFFTDYKMFDLSSIYGIGRQPMTALDFLVSIGAIKAIVVDAESGAEPKLQLDQKKIKDYFVDRQFGPMNPFLRIPEMRLVQKAEIDEAVDALRWDAALILYVCFWRMQAFHVEMESDGYKKIVKDVEAFIASIWSEINTLKAEFKDGITLGYDSTEDRREREERYKIALASKSKNKEAVEEGYRAPSAQMDALSHFMLVRRDGMEDLARPVGYIDPNIADKYREPKAWKGKSKLSQPEELLFLGEILSLRAPDFKVVAQAREGLKKILTRHLGSQTGVYPVRLNDDGIIEYSSKIANGAEQAFNSQAQQRLNVAANYMSRVLFGHTWQFGLVGGALEDVRQSGIMPPNLFRYMRFSDETRSMWWFVQNLGSPSAYPEVAAMFEHFRAERATGLALMQPYIRSSIEGLAGEAQRYMTDETTEELVKTLGRDALLDLVKERRKAARDASNNLDRDMIGELLGKGKINKSFIDGLKEAKSDKQAEDAPKGPKLGLGEIDPVEAAQAAADQTGGSMMEILRSRVLPRQIEAARAAEQQKKMAEELMKSDAEAQTGENKD